MVKVEEQMAEMATAETAEHTQTLEQIGYQALIPSIIQLMSNYNGVEDRLNMPEESFQHELGEILQTMRQQSRYEEDEDATPLALLNHIQNMSCWFYRFRAGDQYFNPLSESWSAFLQRAKHNRLNVTCFQGDSPYPPADMIREYLCK